MLQLECSELILNHAWIDNQKTGSSDGRTFTVEDPADGTVLATLPDCGTVEAEAAVDRCTAGLLQLAHTAGKRTGTASAGLAGDGTEACGRSGPADLARTRESRSAKAGARSPMAPPISSGLPKRPSGSTAM